MPPRIIQCVLFAIASVTGLVFATSPQNLPKCGAARVNYAQFDESYASKFLLEAFAGSKNSLPAGEKVYSPQHTQWLIEQAADYMRPGPWTTHFYFARANSQPDLVLTVLDHGNTIDVRWLNEKLLYGQVWWGRIYSTDFILDVETRKFVYREMAQYSELIEPCQ